MMVETGELLCFKLLAYRQENHNRPCLADVFSCEISARDPRTGLSISCGRMHKSIFIILGLGRPGRQISLMRMLRVMEPLQASSLIWCY